MRRPTAARARLPRVSQVRTHPAPPRLSPHHRTPPSQVASYAFLLPDDANVVRRVMLPLLDLLNHANDEAANAVVGREGGGEGGAFVARATRAIAAGEEVRRRMERGWRACGEGKGG